MIRMASLAVVLMLAGCGSVQVVADPDEHTQTLSVPTPVTPTPKPPLPPKKCPPDGASITLGVVEPALGHRAVAVTLTNCGSKTLTINGYPEVAVLNEKRQAFKLTVAHGSSYMATDPGPTRIRLAKGKTVLAIVAWSNTVTYGDNNKGSYFAISWRKGVAPVIWPEYVDIGTTGKITLTAWNPKVS